MQDYQSCHHKLVSHSFSEGSRFSISRNQQTTDCRTMFLSSQNLLLNAKHSKLIIQNINGQQSTDWLNHLQTNLNLKKISKDYSIFFILMSITLFVAQICLILFRIKPNRIDKPWSSFWIARPSQPKCPLSVLTFFSFRLHYLHSYPGLEMMRNHWVKVFSSKHLKSFLTVSNRLSRYFEPSFERLSLRWFRLD